MWGLWLGGFLAGLACPNEAPWWGKAGSVLLGMLIGALAEGLAT